MMSFFTLPDGFLPVFEKKNILDIIKNNIKSIIWNVINKKIKFILKLNLIDIFKVLSS